MSSSRGSSIVVVWYFVVTTKVTPFLNDTVTAASSGPVQPSHLPCGLPPRKGSPCPTAVGAGCLAVVAPALHPNPHTHTHTHTRCCLKPGSSIALRAGGHINQRPWVLWANQYLFIPGRAVVEPGEAQRDCKMSPVLKPLLEGRGFFVLLLPNSAWHS